ncbi:hypothetical protein HYH96_17235 [Clostridium botulinum]|uniref:Uncharacterized protein n=2 Tax=Clostridium botulinum TaxID=1491 RepID=A0A6B4HPL6_CLOBO|nr:hypothetical protein [Clostridium botulinum]ACA57389.1 hypothetical protein CLK_A0046 [Clostridium botulinum A3 str. Loch Maree]ACA47094.1 hypothetical protein CLD_A0111 [Clostridium botulinum B1 str. Okra]MBD5580889.1 hypothetical protein [Clostridium botulinum]MBD5592978.1 hypothetical protein [Clostridium botulinum]MBD5625270.1 hypothetical protein [Clostridium botulinum]
MNDFILEVRNLSKCESSENMAFKERYHSRLNNFNNHKWVDFYEDGDGQPNVHWAEGCHDIGLEGLNNFETRVNKEYGEDKNNLIYRTYMLESDKLRLALNLQARNIGAIIQINNFNSLLEERKDKIKEYLNKLLEICQNKEIECDDEYFASKNLMWLSYAIQNIKEINTFNYLSSYGEDFYYDLVTINYLNTKIAMPVPVLAKILVVDEKIIYHSFLQHYDRNKIDFV